MKIKNVVLFLICLLFFCNCANLKLSYDFNKVGGRYVISSEINLQGGTLNIPKNSTLEFRGGKIVNGILVCNNTSFNGIPYIENLIGTINNQEFHSSWIHNESKLAILCQIETNKIILDEDITLKTHQSYVFKSLCLDGAGHTIKVEYDLMGLNALMKFFNNVKCVENINFDFCNNEFHSIALYFPNRKESLKVSHISFSNLKNYSVQQHGFEGIVINAKEKLESIFNKRIRIEISNVSANNLKALTDNSGKEGEATMTIAYVNCNFPSNVNNFLDIYVEDCDFKEIVVINKAGEIVANDVACVYVHQDYTSTNSRVYIKNITGYNFGRRLVKTDGSNLVIDNIRGESYNGGSLSLVGCNNGGVTHSADKAAISNLYFKGRINYVIACMVNNSRINGIHAEFTDYASPRVLSGVVFVGDDASCSIDGIRAEGKCYLYSSTSHTQASFRNVRIKTDDSIPGVHYLFNTIDIHSLELSDFTFDVNGLAPTITTYQNASPRISRINSHIILKDGKINIMGDKTGSVLTDYSTRHPYLLSIENVDINVNRGTAPVFNIFSPTLQYFSVNNVKVNFKHPESSAKIMNLKCNDRAKYFLSNISSNNKFKSAPISITKSSKARVSMSKISVDGEIAEVLR